MSKLWKELMNFASHNTGVVVGQLICFAVLIWIYGCESQVASIRNPTQKVTRSELLVEVDSFLAVAELRFTDLDRQDEFRRTIFEQAALWAQGGIVNPTGLALLLMGIIGGGATVDNVTKRRRENKALRRYVEVKIEKDENT